MASVNQTRPHCVNQTGKTHSKPLAARHGRSALQVSYRDGLNSWEVGAREYFIFKVLVHDRLWPQLQAETRRSELNVMNK